MALYLPPAARPAACGVSAPSGSGSGRLADGAGTPPRVRRKLTIAGRDYGKGEGGRTPRPSGRGHSADRAVLAVAKRGEAPPLESPAIAGRRSPASGTAPPSLASISVCGLSIAGVSPERSLSPARNAPKGAEAAVAAVLGGRGRTRSKTGQAPNGGGGEGAKPSPTTPWWNRGRPTWPA